MAAWLLPLILLHLMMISSLQSADDLTALIDFKNQITDDPLGIMASWNQSFHHYCNWTGITCDLSNKRVRTLNLESQKLVGSLPPSLGNLTFLTGLELSNNSFKGQIPQELGLLSNLIHLNLTNNILSGPIPSTLSNCTKLTVLFLEYNQLIGQIPTQFSSLSELTLFSVKANNLTGTFPEWIGNLSSRFSRLSLAANAFHGSIPPQIGQLSGLVLLHIAENRFSGELPPSIYNLSSMVFFAVAINRFQGEIPQDIGLRFPNLREIQGGMNNFTGEIPLSFANSSKLRHLDMAVNSFTGTVLSVLGSLPFLYRINFEHNLLGSREEGDLNFLSSLTNCTELLALGLFSNSFGGELPLAVTNLSTKLQALTLGNNYLHGNLPDDIGKLQKLSILQFDGNEFNGTIPTTFGNLISLNVFYLNNNKLQGNIPPQLGNCTRLLELNISSNNLTGSIPKEVMSISSLSAFLGLAQNSLSGPLPDEVSRLTHLKELDVSGNELSGPIPSSLSRCLSLEVLNMGGNRFDGAIPESLGALRGLEVIDFSHNNLSGKIPQFLGKLPLVKKLDLSYNNLEGEVMNEGVFSNASAVSVVGNKQLCGGASSLNLSACSIPASKSNKNHKLRWILPLIISLTLLLVLICSLGLWYRFRKPKKQQNYGFSTNDSHLAVSYYELHKATNGFSAENLIGSGSFGSVYKGVLAENGSSVAVKVLNLQQKGAIKSFLDECQVLRSTRHRNLLKIVTVCSSFDPKGREFKSLVTELMANGSLEAWLHPSRDARGVFPTRTLNIMERLNIAIDVASAVDYISTHGDVYSFGILVLELFTGKRPTDDMFEEGLSIHKYVSMALSERAIKVVDPTLILAEEAEKENERDAYEEDLIEVKKAEFQKLRSREMEILASVLKIGVSCSVPSPENRMPISAVVKQLHSLRVHIGKDN